MKIKKSYDRNLIEQSSDTNYVTCNRTYSVNLKRLVCTLLRREVAHRSADVARTFQL